MLTDKRVDSRFAFWVKGDRVPTVVDRVLAHPVYLLLIAVIGLGVLPVLGGLSAWMMFSEPIKAFLSSQFNFSLLMMGLVIFLILHLCPGCIWAERKISAYIQDRHGPNRVGYVGLLQPIADGIKFILKEEIIPKNVDRPIFLLAPLAAFFVAFTTFAVIPWAGEITWPWLVNGESVTVTTQVASLDVGILYMLAVGSLSVYGVVLAGWASNNKYSFYGGLRAAAQMISYEVPMGLAILVILLVAGTLRPEQILAQQASTGVWYVFLQPLACILLLITAFAETQRAPFDFAECEQELVGGFHTEYSGMKFALFPLSEYTHMMVSSALIVTIFFGGWHLWFVPLTQSDDRTILGALAKFGVFWTKVAFFIVLFMIIRWTLPRFRFDQLMRLAWKGMIPAGLLLLVGAATLAAFGLQRHLLANLVVNAIALGVILTYMTLAPSPVTGRQENMPEIEVRPAQERGRGGAAMPA